MFLVCVRVCSKVRPWFSYSRKNGPEVCGTLCRQRLPRLPSRPVRPHHPHCRTHHRSRWLPGLGSFSEVPRRHCRGSRMTWISAKTVCHGKTKLNRYLESLSLSLSFFLSYRLTSQNMTCAMCCLSKTKERSPDRVLEGLSFAICHGVAWHRWPGIRL